MHLAQMHDLWQRGGIILRRDSAQDCIETQQQLFGLKRLGQIVIRASLKPDDPILGLTLSGQQQNRCIAGPSQLFGQRNPILARHHHIQNDQIEVETR